MSKGRYMIQSSRSCFRRWQNTPRLLMLCGIIGCFAIIYGIPFAENAKVQNEPLHCTELLTAMLNWRFTMLLFSTIFLLLFGDLPVIESFSAHVILRGTRKSWMVSQVFYVLITSLLMVLLLVFVTFLITLPNISFSDDWSKPVKLLATSGRIALPPERMKLPFPSSIIFDYTPWQAFMHSTTLFFFMGCFYGLATLTLRMKFRSGSFVLLLIVNTLSWATGMFAVGDTGYALLSLLSIHYHSTLHLHSSTALNPLLPSLGASYAILIGLICIAALLAMLLVKRYDFVDTEDE